MDREKTKIEMMSEEATTRKEVLANARKREVERLSERQEKESYYSEWLSLLSAKNTKTILRGTIAGIEGIKYEGEYGIFLTIIYNGKFKILVPFKEIYKEFPIDMNTVDTTTEEGKRDFIRRQKAMAEKMYGLSIPFIITHMESDTFTLDSNYVVAASRREANSIIEEVNYRKDSNGLAKINEGDIVKATITSVSRYSIAVNVGGIDAQIPLRNITYRYISSPSELKTLFSVGEVIDVEILKIETIGERRKLELSAKSCELREAQKRQRNLINEGMLCTGVITNVLKKQDRVYAFIWLDQYEMPAVSDKMPPLKNGKVLVPGEQVRVKVLSIYENGLIRVQCRGTHGTATYASKF